MKLFREEISKRKSKLNTFEKDFIVLKRESNKIDYTHICCLFLKKNDNKLKHKQDIHTKKLFDLGFENSQISHDPNKVIFNYSSHVVTGKKVSL